MIDQECICTFDEIAATLKLPRSTVVSTFYRAMAKLRRVQRLREIIREYEELTHPESREIYL